MGCFDSKMDAKRKALADDWTGNDFAFAVGSAETMAEFCPVDKLVLELLGESAELKDKLGEIKDHAMAEDKAKELGNKIFEGLKALHADFEKTKDSDDLQFGKYTGKVAFK